MLNKSDLRDRLTEALEDRDIEDADEIADWVVETLDEEGAFEVDADDDE